MTMNQRDWTKHPWSFVSSRYGPRAEEAMIKAHEVSGEFGLEHGYPPNCPRCRSPNITGPFDGAFSCNTCYLSWAQVRARGPRMAACKICGSTEIVRVGDNPPHARCTQCGEDWDL